MQASNIHPAEIVFLLLLLFVVAFGLLARKLKTPYPLVLVIAGLVLSLIPQLPNAALNPSIIFFVILPPLLYSGAWFTSWRDFRHNLVSILSLAVGLVAFTVFGVTEITRWMFPGFDWRVGFALGAVVATTDTVAALSIARRIGLPKSIADLLEGEGLVNDAVGLLALEFAVAMLGRGETLTVWVGVFRFFYITIIGLGIGLALGWVVHRFERLIDDAPIEITLSFLVPYAGYLAAEAVHASGVLAVVACGLYLSRRSADLFSATVRTQTYAVWNAITFVLNGLVFVLIGLQLPYVVAGIKRYSFHTLVLYGALFSGLVIVLRLIWVFPGAHISNWIRRRILRQDEALPAARQLFVVGWTGMRGVIALAAAISLPFTLAHGRAFPQRNLIVFLTFCVILATLVLQGLTLPPLIRALGLAGTPGSRREEEEARRIALEAALQHLNEARRNDQPKFAGVYDNLEQRYRLRLEALEEKEEKEKNGDENADSVPEHYTRFRDLSRELLEVQRRSAVRLRDEGRINDEVLRELEHELDLSEIRLHTRSHR